MLAISCRAWLALGDPPASSSTTVDLAKQVDQAVAKLDDEFYEARETAARDLRRLARLPECGQLLSRAFAETLLRPDASFETRARIADLAAQSPSLALAPPATEVSAEEIAALAAHLDSSSSAIRLGSSARLQWILGLPEHAYPVLTRLKSLLADPKSSSWSRKEAIRLADRARREWLLSEPSRWRLSPIEPAQVETWLDALAWIPPERRRKAPAPGKEDPLAGSSTEDEVAARVKRSKDQRSMEMAAMELRDALARDDLLDATKAAIERRLAAPGLSPLVEGRLRTLWDWTRPAMVAEYWSDGRHHGIQHLLIGVPNQTVGQRTPSHFDRIDDTTAHCVSGQSLSPGDYPVGIFLPHPKSEEPGAAFHLVNLPTPGRRMAYEVYVQLDDSIRLAPISQRTLRFYLNRRQRLSTEERHRLPYLDAAALSEFVGAFCLAVEDGPLDHFVTHHEAVCLTLLPRGKHVALPSLLEAIDGGRFAPPREEFPFSVAWHVALEIAHRERWEGDDEWLLNLVDRTEPLVGLGKDPAPVGATAAALLVERHQLNPADYGLERSNEPPLADVRFVTYRFTRPDGALRFREAWSAKFAGAAKTGG